MKKYFRLILDDKAHGNDNGIIDNHYKRNKTGLHGNQAPVNQKTCDGVVDFL